MFQTDQFFDFTNAESKAMFQSVAQHFIATHDIADPEVEIYRVLPDGKKQLRFRLTPAIEH